MSPRKTFTKPGKVLKCNTMNVGSVRLTECRFHLNKDIEIIIVRCYGRHSKAGQRI